MDARKPRLLEDLAGVFRGELLCDPVACAQYATDGSLHQILPLGVARPRDRDDLVTLVQYAAEERIPLIARGAGTSVAGESLGDGLIVDFSRFMNRVLTIHEETVEVEAGVVLEQLNRVLAPQGRYFAPDPANAATTTIGGMLAIDAAGSHSIRVGSTRDHVHSLDLVLASGQTHTLGTESVAESLSPQPDEPPALTNRRQLISQLAPLLRRHADKIQEIQPSRQFRNRAGYFLRNVLLNGSLNFPRLLVGSEGTLALTSSAVLSTLPLPAHRGLLLFIFGSVESAVEAVRRLSAQQPSACDLIDRRLLTLGREIDDRFAALIPANAEAALLVEQTGSTPHQVQRRLELLRLANQSQRDPGFVALQTNDAETVDFIWSLPRRVVPLLNRIRGARRPVPFVEDLAVPPEALGEFLTAARNVLQKYEITATLYAHAAAGQLHLRPFWSNTERQDCNQMLAFASELYDQVLAHGGTISGEHGLGLSRSAYLRQQVGPLYPVFEQIKQLFDPHNLLNPGKVLNNDAGLATRYLRSQDPSDVAPSQLKLAWPALSVLETSSACNGCGNCKSGSDKTRMCPVFRRLPAEEASPRAKANSLRVLLQDAEHFSALSTEAVQPLLDTCINCKQCQLECPAEVDIPKLVLEMRSQYVAAHGLPRGEWLLSHIHQWPLLIHRLRPFFNKILTTSQGRWLLEKLTGISAERRLPVFQRRSFLETLSVQRATPPLPVIAGKRTDDTVVYFVDHQARYHDLELAEAFCGLLEQAGLTVHVPQQQRPSGMALITVGDVVAARKIAEENVTLLAEHAREGRPIVCTEPSAVICLTQEYPSLLGLTEDVQLVAQATREAGAYLSSLHHEGRLRCQWQPLPWRVVYHQPCHLRALNQGTPLADLCRQIPDLQIETPETGCSGMAGTYGLLVKNQSISTAMGRDLGEQLQPFSPDYSISECSSCRMQLAQFVDCPTLHPLKLLAISAGVLPQPKLIRLPESESHPNRAIRKESAAGRG